jgi:hypothetical protein
MIHKFNVLLKICITIYQKWFPDRAALAWCFAAIQMKTPRMTQQARGQPAIQRPVFASLCHWLASVATPPRLI